MEMVREVIAARPTHGGTNFEDVLGLQERTLRRRSLLFLVSDFAGFDQAASDVLARLGRRHDVVAARVAAHTQANRGDHNGSEAHTSNKKGSSLETVKKKPRNSQAKNCPLVPSSTSRGRYPLPVTTV